MPDVIDAGTNQTPAATDASTSLLTSSTDPVSPTPTDPVKAADPAQTATPDAAAPADPAKPDPEAKPPVGAPEKYEFAVEGVTLNPKAIEAFEPVARKLNLTNEQANELVALQAKFVTENSQAQMDAWMSMRKEWVASIKADKEIGGTNLDVSLTNARKVIKEYGTPALEKALADYGMGDHPELVRMLAKIGKARAEDKFVGGSPAASVPVEAAFYPTMQKKS